MTDNKLQTLLYEVKNFFKIDVSYAGCVFYIWPYMSMFLSESPPDQTKNN